MYRYTFKLLLWFGLVLVLGGCLGGGTKSPTLYYLIDPIDYSNPVISPDEPLSIAIIDLNIPQYLERFHIARRSSDNRLEFSENHQWGESLRKNLLRTMARNLSRLLSTIDIGTPLNRSSSVPDYSLLIHIEQFELLSDMTVQLSARWQLGRGVQYEPVGVFNANLNSNQKIEEGNYEQMVSVMRELFGQLSERIAESIIEQE